MVALMVSIFFGAVFIIIVLDVVAFKRGGENATLSLWLYNISRRRPIIPALLCFSIGVLVGHLWWQNLCN